MKRLLYFALAFVVLINLIVLSFFVYKLCKPHAPITRAAARIQFLQAEQALANHDEVTFNALTKQLKNYPLYPYLVASDLSSRIDTLPKTEVDNFLQTYTQSYAASQLRGNWLLALARVGHWEEFLRYYQPSKKSQLLCLYAQALYHTNDRAAADALGQQLWLVPYSQVSDCDNLFTALQTDNVITPDLTWQRFLLTIQKGSYSFAQTLQKQLPLDKQADAERWLIVKKNPLRINDVNLFPHNAENYNDILTFGLTKLADATPDNAVAAWTVLQKNHQFTHEQTQKIIQSIAVGFIKTNHDKANPWLSQLNPEYFNDLAMNWRLRFALQERNWRGLLAWIESLPKDEQQQAQWQYWQARSLEELDQKSAADMIYQELAQQRGYYGFLAADKLGLPYAIHNEPSPITRDEYQEILNNPATQRVSELFALKRKDLAEQEWKQMLTTLNEQQRYVAARLAYNLRWTQIALSTTSYVNHPNDLLIRYPKFFYSNVKKQSQSYNLGTDFIYAIIRQESLFKPDAVSYVGAIGLMQLMPTTAKMLVDEDNLPGNYADNLQVPKVNIKLGSQYLSRLMVGNQQSVMLSAAAYNAGPHKVRSWLPQTTSMPADIWVDMIPYTQTRTYVHNVISNAVVYQYLDGRQPDIKTLMPDVQPKN